MCNPRRRGFAVRGGGCEDVRDEAAVWWSGPRRAEWVQVTHLAGKECLSSYFRQVILVFLELEKTQMAPRRCVQTQAQCGTRGRQNKGLPGGKSPDPQNP